MGANLWIDIGSQGTSLDQFPNRFTAKSMTGSGKDQPRDSTWFFVTDETDGDCRDTRICCFCRLYRWAKQQIAVSPASVSFGATMDRSTHASAGYLLHRTPFAGGRFT